MRPIIADIITLAQYLEHIKQQEIQAPAACSHCGAAGLWCHGHYERKPDREPIGNGSFNPIPIYRFYCPGCRRTCSVLPECICPYRWYLWAVQQAVLLKCLLGQSIYKIVGQVKPSRRTIKRWWQRLQERFTEHASCLRALMPSLGYSQDISAFWQAVLAKLRLSQAMLLLNNQQVVVP